MNSIAKSTTYVLRVDNYSLTQKEEEELSKFLNEKFKEICETKLFNYKKVGHDYCMIEQSNYVNIIKAVTFEFADEL
jgi:hypothetical protein